VVVVARPRRAGHLEPPGILLADHPDQQPGALRWDSRAFGLDQATWALTDGNLVRYLNTWCQHAVAAFYAATPEDDAAASARLSPRPSPELPELPKPPLPPTPAQLDAFLKAEAVAKRIPPYIAWNVLVRAAVERFKTERNLSIRNLRDHLEALALYTPKKNR
jgi:hypothetical protein